MSYRFLGNINFDKYPNGQIRTKQNRLIIGIYQETIKKIRKKLLVRKNNSKLTLLIVLGFILFILTEIIVPL